MTTVSCPEIVVHRTLCQRCQVRIENLDIYIMWQPTWIKQHPSSFMHKKKTTLWQAGVAATNQEIRNSQKKEANKIKIVKGSDIKLKRWRLKKQ